MVKVLLERGATVNLEDNLGRTSLHMVSLAQGASISGENGVCIAQLLLEYGEGVNVQDNKNATPLDFTGSRRSPRCAVVLKPTQRSIRALPQISSRVRISTTSLC